MMLIRHFLMCLALVFTLMMNVCSSQERPFSVYGESPGTGLSG